MVVLINFDRFYRRGAACKGKAHRLHRASLVNALRPVTALLVGADLKKLAAPRAARGTNHCLSATISRWIVPSVLMVTVPATEYCNPVGAAGAGLTITSELGKDSAPAES